MPVPKGTKTAAAGAVAAGSLTTAFIDPSGISLLTFLGSSAVAAVGTTYHAVRGISKHASHSMEESRQRKAESQALAMRMTPHQHIRFQHDVENTIRRLTSSLEGSVVQGILFIGLPYMGIIWAINTVEASVQLGRLKALADRAGGKRALAKAVSKQNAVLQVFAGAAIKTLTISLTLGHDFEAAMGDISGRIDDAEYKGMLMDAKDGHNHLLEEPVFKQTTTILDIPQTEMKEFMEKVEGNFNGEAQNWAWKEEHSAEGVVAVGAVVAAVNKAVDVAVDDPLHQKVERAGGTTV
ncbi:uncharacterized protein CTRU02_204817 [Colletotrichum truncatum]|uniref:Uncharacterized protein n=1 Tax=Colletotrichum truncatum TaxID=5467 RepID=A0ACC3ZDA2_COLTU|nr:uncharacterized protein CTRU02_03051 [Colletotrichum truncatum]KAF6798009.1 hypothetical protein CTRU02_03051 [Colletotrichum truncatum]